MKVGVQINRFNYPEGDSSIRNMLRSVAQGAERADIDSLWVMDHFFQIGHLGPKTDPMLEAYTTLGFLAGVTEKPMLGTLVTGVIYREPALLIKAVTTLDVVSGGRAYFGIGAGWNDEEATALALPNPLTSQRFDRLEDTLKLAKQMWAGDEKPFKGKLYELPEPINRPQVLSRPHPPIMIGGGGEQKTLRMVAEYGDACNLFWNSGKDLIKHKLEVLRRHCDDVGRDYNEIEKTALVGFSVAQAAHSIDDIVATAKEMKNEGFNHLILRVGEEDDLSVYAKLRSVVDKLHEI
jgi:F420-dependent oxidoreductase-like protein